MTALSANTADGMATARLIAEIWRSRVEGIIHQVQNGLEDYLEISNLYEHISDDYHGRFLIELIQNGSDQAQLAGLTESTVDIVRTHERLYVANQGLAFTPKGLTNMTRLGLSDKDPSKAIGNKGVGFKSVRQVSDRAEVYSAPDAHSAFAVGGGLRFGIRLSGSLNEVELERLRDLAFHAATSGNHARDDEMARTQVEPVLAALARTPPFRFPFALRDDDLRRALEELGGEIAARAQTVVVLELLKDDQAAQVVDHAIDELLQHGGASVLFLPAVTAIQVEDRTRDLHVRISRQTLSAEQRGEVFLARVKTAVHSETGETEREWHKVERTLGATGSEEAAVKSAAIHEAAKLLPGEGWDEVRTATVSVALPAANPSDLDGAPLHATGLFAIGLPTRKRTGTPFWVDGRFHGKISRTEIDLEQTPYNALLFEGAKNLVCELLELLRNAPDRRDRRLVTLAMNAVQGELSTWMRSDDGPASGRVVLMPDGQDFQRGIDLRLPRLDDVDFVLRLSADDPELLAEHGYVLPEPPILREGKKLLESLGAVFLRAPKDTRMLKRAHDASLLEKGARDIRGSGPVVWELFLNDVLDRFDAGDLDDQRILPIGQDELAKPNERIFYAPVAEEVEGEVLSIPQQVAHDLRFLDESAVPMREGTRLLTPIGRRISEDRTGLVRPPRRERLIADAIAPRIASLASEARHAAALALLAQAIEWLPGVSQDEVAAAIRNVQVPCASPEGDWIWRKAHEVYFGQGWLGASPSESHREELISKAFSRPGGRLVVPWHGFETAAAPHDRAWWRDGFAQLGVNSVPRLLTTEALGRSSDFRAWVYRLQTKPGRLPQSLPPDAEPLWRSHVERLASETPGLPISRGEFLVRRVIWVEGLEDPGAREAVFELMLFEPRRYLEAATTTIVRAPLMDYPVAAPAFWLDVVRHEDWAVIPTAHHGAQPPSKTWLPAGDGSMRSGGYADLPEVRREFSRAAELLAEIGVASLANPSAGRAISALHDVATAIRNATTSSNLRDLDVLSQKLYEGLSRACDRDEVDLTPLVAQQIPARVGGALLALDLQSVEAVYIDDAPARGQFIQSDLTHPFLPIPPRSAIAGLIRALSRVLGTQRIMRTSEAEIETGFRAEGEERRLAEFLGSSLTLDLALLVAYGRRNVADPSGEAFRATWDIFARSRLRYGAFPAGGRAFAYGCFFDPGDPDGPRLDVATEDLAELIPLLWTIFGPDARDPLVAYASAFGRGERERFFLERGIGDLERHDVEDALGASADANLDKVQDVLYAIWVRGRLAHSLAEFLGEWSSRSGVDDRARWLGIESHALANLLREADDQSRVDVLNHAAVAIEEWQKARGELRLSPYSFAQAEKDLLVIRNALVWGLASVAAHSPGVDLEQASVALEEIRDFKAAHGVTLRPALSAGDINAIVLDAVDTLRRSRGVDVLLSRLDDIASLRPSRAADVAVRYASQREIDQFREISAAQRTQWAQLTLENLLKVAAALALRRGIVFDEAAIRADQRVASLSSGWWASDFALLQAVESVIRKLVGDEFAATLVVGGAFRDPPHDWRRLWGRFDELGPLPVESALSPPPAVQLGPLSLTVDQIKLNLREKGPQGVVGLQLIKAVDDASPFSALRATDHLTAALPTRRPRRAPGERPVRVAKPPRPETNEDRELNGLLGEVFVFEEFRRHLPGFDERCWVSENRLRYIPSPVGASDAEAYDFEYRDLAGELTGRAGGTNCHIEVKATAGDGANPFPISSAEWEHAKHCHQTQSALYVIVRVAAIRSPHPLITDMLIDPIDMWQHGKIAIDAQNFWLHLGARSPKADSAEQEAS